jgi:hypothetical protein
MRRWLVMSCAVLTCLAPGCGDDDDTTAGAGGGGGVAGVGGAAGGECEPRDPSEIPDMGECEPRDDDYAPCREDEWEPCIADDGEYLRIEQTVSSIARVKSFESIAELLFDPTRNASTDDFLQARLIYQEDEGLDSRVVRRYDPHFDKPAEGGCEDEGVPDDYPEYCVGPARLQPLILEALNAGIGGDEPGLQAATVEAALLWFFYVSAYKESLTCTEKAKDCDSSYAYYTGGEEARGGIGLARYVDEVDPAAHDRAWDGLLAVRCWRDIDDGDIAGDLELRDRARNQYDRAILDGVAAIVRDRLQKFDEGTGGERDYYWAFVRTLGPVLLREAAERSATDAATLGEEIEKEQMDVKRAVAAIDSVFECP